MLPKRFLHYEVVEKIHNSGMSEIYKVKNLKLAGREEALKLLNEKYRNKKSVYNRFRKEAEILSAFNHPCIPVIYEINEFRNRPFLTMEFVNGKSLLDITEYKILSLGKILTISREVVSALTVAHARGIIHRDLKLSNIMVTQEGSLKIIDFGLAATGWMTPEQDKGFIIGTLPYMSPEQTRGEQLDHRSDIFSLGICMYELITGRLPFFDPDPDEVLRRVQEDKPRSLREQRPETPESLESCIFQCIEKDPARRFQGLDELAEVLEEVEIYLKERGENMAGSEAVRERMETLTMDMVAREDEYGLLAQNYFRALSGKGTAVFIQGEAGIGKTRLIEELLKHCNASEVYTASGQAHPGMTIPYRPIAEAIRYLLLACDVVSDEEIEDFIDIQYGSDSVQARILKTFLLHVPSDELEIAGRENLFDTVADLLAGFARRAPLVMILENMHWADKATLDLLLHLTGSIQGRKILLVTSFRPNEPGQEPGFPLNTFADIAEAKSASGDAVLVPLQRLNQAETRSLVNFHFPGNKLKKGFFKRIYKESDGNPLFILELLKLFSRLGIVTRARGAWIQAKGEEEFPVPTRIHDLISRRLSCLGEKEMDVLEAAAVEGISFTSDAVGTLTGIDRLTLLNMLRSLWRQQLIDLKGDSYRFNPPLVREVLYRRMLPELKREYHLRLANIYLQHPPPGQDRAADLARHFHLGGDLERALKHYMVAGYAALNLYADREALEYFDLSLELLGDAQLGAGAKTALDIHLHRAEIFIRMGQPEKSREAAEEALGLARNLAIAEDLGRAFKVIGKISLMHDDSQTAQAFLERALANVDSTSDRAEVLSLLGLTAENLGNHEKAMHFFSHSLDISSAEGNRLREAQTLNHMGRTFFNKGEHGAALMQFRKALNITAEIGDKRGIAVNTNNVGILLRRMDRLSHSLRILFQAARIFKEIRYPNGVANSLWNIGKVFLAQGERRKADKYILKAKKLFERIGSERGASLCHLTRSALLVSTGALEEAFLEIDQALEAGRKICYPRVVAYALASRGTLELRLGFLEESGESLRAAEEAARDCKDLLLSSTIFGQLGLAECMSMENGNGRALMEKALEAAVQSKDPTATCDVHLLLCRAQLMANEVSGAEKNFFKASATISRNARSARKAALYFESGLLEFYRKGPLQAFRKFETAHALYRGLDAPLRILECLHGLTGALLHLDMADRLVHYENAKKSLMEQLKSAIPTARGRDAFSQYHGAGGPLSFLQNFHKGDKA